MKRWWPWAAVFLGGLALGAGGLRWVETFTVDRELARLKAEEVRLADELHHREAELDLLQLTLKEQSGEIRAEVARALDEADRVLASQGSVVDRLKLVVAALRKLRADLAASGIN